VVSTLRVAKLLRAATALASATFLASAVLAPLHFAGISVPTAAACDTSWGSLVTRTSPTYSVPHGTYQVTVKYKLEFNLCTHSYSRIYVSSGEITHVITHTAHSDSLSKSDFRQVVDCSRLTTGCLVYPGTAYYDTEIDFSHRGTGTVQYTFYPGIYMPYTYAAGVWESWDYETQYMEVFTNYAYHFIANTLEYTP
jgi:hypothetical protein